MTDIGNPGAGALHPTEVRVYVNERGVSVPPGSTALDAVRLCSIEQGDQLAAGRARLTDSRGLPIDAACPASGGLILRVLPVRDRTSPDTSPNTDMMDTTDGTA
jgi:hypothetical protein